MPPRRRDYEARAVLRIGMVAGEASGDSLGAGLIDALRRAGHAPRVEGIGGDRLIAAGMRVLYPMERLSVMGITEVFGRYRELRKIQNGLRDHFLRHRPDVFIGIDAPDFNLGLERGLRRAGIKTVHYVSPSVWAWREYRLKKIRRAVDLMLNLFPFEQRLYDQYRIPNHYVGHPLADQLAPPSDHIAARSELGIPAGETVVALLPGSRINEINKIAGPLLGAARICLAQKRLYLVCALLDERALARFAMIKKALAPDLDIALHAGRTRRVMAAADVILAASGTVTLEAMLLKKPMVVAYKLNWLSYFIVKLLAKIPYAALPNILAGKMLVAECLQADCKSEIIARELSALINSEQKRIELQGRFAELAGTLRKNADRQAATAVLRLLDQRQGAG